MAAKIRLDEIDWAGVETLLFDRFVAQLGRLALLSQVDLSVDTVDKNKSVVTARAVLANAAVDGFLYIPTVAGVPSGVPTAKTGAKAMVYDTTNNDLYVYNGAWKKVHLA